MRGEKTHSRTTQKRHRNHRPQAGKQETTSTACVKIRDRENIRGKQEKQRGETLGGNIENKTGRGIKNHTFLCFLLDFQEEMIIKQTREIIARRLLLTTTTTNGKR